MIAHKKLRIRNKISNSLAADGLSSGSHAERHRAQGKIP